MPQRYERPPRREAPTEQNNPNLDLIVAHWFEHAPKEEVDLSTSDGVLHSAQTANPAERERQRSWFERQAHSRFANLVPALVAMMAASCEMDLEQASKGVDLNTIVPLELTEEQGDVVITLNADTAIRISDYAGRAHWDAPLLGVDNHEVEHNVTFQMHERVMRDQYERSIRQEDHLYQADQHGPLGTTVKYTSEPSRMYPGEYPSYGDVYGNMALGATEDDVLYAKNYLETSWLQAANAHFGEHYKTVQDLEALTAAQWMVVLQEPTSALTYDPTLTSLYPQYDAAKTQLHIQKTIAELLEASNGVCRDFERLNISSYVLADEEFHLAERGLLYIPQVNMSDAAHTEGIFMFAKSATETIVVGVNSTDATGDRLDSFIAVPDTAAWYSQQYGKEFVDSPDHAIEAYQGTLDILGADMNPTARAMLKREVVLANLRGAELADNQVDKKKYLESAFTGLQNQLIEEAALNTPTLDRPSRVVPMYDLLLATAAAYDEVDRSSAAGLHTVAARSLFESYLQKHTGVELDAAREAVELIDRAGTQQERNQYYIQLIQLLEQKR